MRRVSTNLAASGCRLDPRGGSGRPRLSVCIPTLNRVEYLEHLLHSVVRHLHPSGLDFEIVVSDNCSDDATAEVLAEWCRTTDRIVAVKTPTRTDHAEDNVYFLLGHAQGDYVWLLGDDDDLVSSGVAALVKVVEAGVADLAIFNSRSHDFYGRPLRDIRIPCHSDVLNLSMHDFVARTGFWFVLSGFSTTLFRREKADLQELSVLLRRSRIYSVVTWLIKQFWNAEVRFVNSPIVSYRQNLSDVQPNEHDVEEMARERARLDAPAGTNAQITAAVEPHWSRVARLEKTFEKGIWTNKFLEQIDFICSATSMRREFVAQVVDRSLESRFVFSYEVLSHFLVQLERWYSDGSSHRVSDIQMAYFIDWSDALFPEQSGLPIILRRIEQGWLDNDRNVIATSTRRLRSVLDEHLRLPWYTRYHVRNFRGYKLYAHGGVWLAVHASRPDLAYQQFEFLDPAPVRPFLMSAPTEAALLKEIDACRSDIERSHVLEAVRVQNASEIASTIAATHASGSGVSPSAVEALIKSISAERNVERARGAQLERALAQAEAQVDLLRQELNDLRLDLNELAVRADPGAAPDAAAGVFPWSLWSSPADGG